MIRYCWKNHKKIERLYKRGKDHIDNSLNVFNIVKSIKKLNNSNTKIQNIEKKSSLLDLDSSDVNEDFSSDFDKLKLKREI